MLIIAALAASNALANEIRAIKYDGLLRMSELIANEISGLKVGEDLDKKRLNDAIFAFYKQDYFDDIYADFEGGVLTFHFKEKPGVASIEVKGYGNESDTKELEKQLGLKKGDTYDIYKEKYAREVIINALETKGIYGSVVDVEKKLQNNGVGLIFNVNKGENITIKRAFYNGATLPKNEVESLSANKERDKYFGWLPWFNDGELKAKELEYDNLRIQDVYMRKGFLDASVSSPLVSVDFANYNAVLLYKIIEGKRYQISGVEVRKTAPAGEGGAESRGESGGGKSGESSGAESGGGKSRESAESFDDLEDFVSLKVGEFFNIESVRYDIETMKSHIMDAGHAFVRIAPDLDKDEENAKVKVIYNVDIGKKVRINDVLITGNVTSSDRIVRREMLIAPGDFYSITQIRKSQNALRRSGFFEKVQISEIRVSEGLINLLVEVSEGRTGEFMFGVGYGSYDRLMLNASLRERNLFGTGNSLQFYVNWSQYSQMYNIGLTNPRIFDSNYSASFNVYKSYFNNYDYTEDSTGFNVSLGRNITDSLSVNLTYELSQTYLNNFTNAVYEALYRRYFPASGVLKSSVTPGFYFDNTDDYYFPKNGAVLSASVEVAGLGGAAKYVKPYGKMGLYYHLKNLINFDLILRYKAQIGAVFGSIEKRELPITSTFYMGGIGTVRGYRTYSLSPVDNVGIRIGGRYLFSNSVEASWGLLEALNMRLAAFFDYGMIGKDSFSQTARMSWGLSLEWVSPIGPLVFVFPFALNPQPNDSTSSFEFTMGTRF